jgi:hypothetical protein
MHRLQKVKGRNNLADLGIDGNLHVGVDSINLNLGRSQSEYGSEPSGSIKGEDDFDHLSNCQFSKRILLHVIAVGTAEYCSMYNDMPYSLF